MKRALIAALLVLVAVPAMAFRPTLRRGDRVAVLRPQVRTDQHVARAVSHYLERELRKQGLDAFDARMTYDDLRDADRGGADYYIEVVASDGDAAPVGGVGVTGRHVGVDVSMVVSRVAATLRLYDAETLELIDELDLRRNASSVMPTGIGIGGHHLGLWIPLPIYGSRYRSAARAVARQAAAEIAPLVVEE